MIYFLIGLFCLLLVIGAVVGKKPLEFAIKSSVVLVAGAFVVAVLFFGYIILKSLGT